MKQQTVTVEEYQALARANWTEEEFLHAVIALAKDLGWRSAHFRPARTRKGWRTPCAGDGKGLPDLILVRGNRLLFVELKSNRGQLTVDQMIWLALLRETPVEVHLWRPENWVHIVRILRGEEIPTTRVAHGEEK